MHVFTIHMARVVKQVQVYIHYQYVCLYDQHFQRSMLQRGMVGDPACGQLNRKNACFPVPRPRLRIWSHITGSTVPSPDSLLILRAQAEWHIFVQAKEVRYGISWTTHRFQISIHLRADV